MVPSNDIRRLLDIMAALRHPQTGCSWDLEQSLTTLVPYVIEEAYEVVDAVERGDREELREELGDLLLQVVFQARLAEEEGSFDFGGVVEAITSKLVRRHPHIFGDKRDLSPAEVKSIWSAIKADEKAARLARDTLNGGVVQRTGLLSGVKAGLPALPRAVRLQAKAGEVGFDWNDPRAVLAKIREECTEVEEVLDDPEALSEEVGDLLFAVVNLARHAKVDPETALRSANQKFVRRFSFIEAALDIRGARIEDVDLASMEALWNEAKADERRRSTP